MAPMPPRTALFAGGGTAGHVFPALAVAAELAGRGWGVRFAGAAAGIEARLVAARGWPFHPLPARPLVGRGPFGRIGALATVGRSAVAAARLIRRHQVGVVVGTGGYVSAPAVLGARLAGRPSLLVEPNARPGVANRWLSRWAAGAVVAYAETGAPLRCPAWVTGVPVRREFHLAAERHPAAAATAAPRLLVLGGSQGSAQLNRAIPAALGAMAGGLPGLEVLHQAGAGKVAETEAAYSAAGLTPGETETCGAVRVRVVAFLDDVAGEMAASHLVVSRGGAVTTAEICAAGRAALLVPLVLAGGHQGDNARRLAEAGAAVVVAPASAAADGDPDLAPRLAAALATLLADGERLAAMGRAARALARPDAAAVIAARIEAVAAGAGGSAAGRAP